MASDFKLPDLGEGVNEGEIVRWLVHEGDPIKEDQPLVEVMTDKATVEIPSPTTGKIKQIMVKEGQIVKVGTTLVTFATGEGLESEHKQESPVTEQPVEQVTKTPYAVERIQTVITPASPAVRKLAREIGVELSSVKASGPGGRITADDVRRAGGSKASPPLEPTSKESGSRVEFIPLVGLRRRIAEKMSKSLNTAAQVTHIDEVDFTQLIALRDKIKAHAESRKAKLTFLPFIMKAVVSALKEYPYFNASIDDEKQQIVLKHYYNIGFAADTPSGLIVPVVKDADKKSILDIAVELDELSNRAREGKIGLDDIQDGTFTITNIGTLGGMISTPIVNYPEVAILGVHTIKKRPVVKDNNIVIRDIASVALTFDHRVVDGADAARFTSKIVSILENPGLFSLDLVRFV